MTARTKHNLKEGAAYLALLLGMTGLMMMAAPIVANAHQDKPDYVTVAWEIPVMPDGDRSTWQHQSAIWPQDYALHVEGKSFDDVRDALDARGVECGQSVAFQLDQYPYKTAKKRGWLQEGAVLKSGDDHDVVIAWDWHAVTGPECDQPEPPTYTEKFTPTYSATCEAATFSHSTDIKRKYREPASEVLYSVSQGIGNQSTAGSEQLPFDGSVTIAYEGDNDTIRIDLFVMDNPTSDQAANMGHVQIKRDACPEPDPEPAPTPEPDIKEGAESSEDYYCDSPANGTAIRTTTRTEWVEVDGVRTWADPVVTIDTVTDADCDYEHPEVTPEPEPEPDVAPAAVAVEAHVTLAG